MTTIQKTRHDFVDHVVETMRDFGPVTPKAMFGGWGLYHEGLFFALIAEDVLYLKVDDDNREPFESAGLPAFVYVTKDGDRMAMSYRQAPPQTLESPAAMTAWAPPRDPAAPRAEARKPPRERKKAG